jgi:hypothetical protein
MLYLLISTVAVAMSFIILNKFIWTDKITALRQLFFVCNQDNNFLLVSIARIIESGYNKDSDKRGGSFI